MGHMPLIPGQERTNHRQLLVSLLISTKMADTDPIASKPKKGKIAVERQMMLKGKDYVGI